MDLPLLPPVKPMLAKATDAVPDQPESGPPAWLYEPKWDGFRCLVFKDGDEVELTSRNTKPLTRYFPEIVEAVRTEALPDRCVLDGELTIGAATYRRGDRTVVPAGYLRPGMSTVDGSSPGANT